MKTTSRSSPDFSWKGRAKNENSAPCLYSFSCRFLAPARRSRSIPPRFTSSPRWAGISRSRALFRFLWPWITKIISGWGRRGTGFGSTTRRPGTGRNIRQEGLGDDCVYALAMDGKDRVWAGHLNHGVSVFNGEKWRNYGIMDGPLGDRVFAMAVSPRMATSGWPPTWGWRATRRRGTIGTISRAPPACLPTKCTPLLLTRKGNCG